MILVTGATGTVGRETAGDIITGWHRAAEQAVAGSGLSWTIVRPGAFMSNTLAWAGMIKHQGQVFAPFGSVKTAAIDPADIILACRYHRPGSCGTWPAPRSPPPARPAAGCSCRVPPTRWSRS